MIFYFHPSKHFVYCSKCYLKDLKNEKWNKHILQGLKWKKKLKGWNWKKINKLQDKLYLSQNPINNIFVDYDIIKDVSDWKHK